MQALQRAIGACDRCSQLAAGRTAVVAGTGTGSARVMVVTELPGAREDALGLPLVGASGHLFDRFLQAAGIEAGDVFVTPLLKCHPVGNREPTPAELSRCREWLDAQVAALRPRVICALGTGPAEALRPEREAARAGGGDHPGPPRTDIGQAAPAWIGGIWTYLLPLPHPLAATYGPAALTALELGIAQLPRLLAEPRPVAVPVGAPATEPDLPEPQADGVPDRAEAGDPRPVQDEPSLAPAERAAEGADGQLGLF